MDRERIAEIFEEHRFKLSEETAHLFSLYLNELLRWNRVHNLTSVREPEEIVRRHFVDSLSLLDCFSEAGARWRGNEVADVGSGAGFPGVPLKIYLRDFKLYLIESVSKKCSFLEFLKVRLGLEWEVICKRAEEVDRKFDIVISRAMGEFEDIYPILESLSKGYVFVMKGERVSERWKRELGYRACRTKVPKLPPSYVLWKRLK